MTFADFGLRQDPFPIAPESSVENWAGDHELRDDLIDLVKGVRQRDIGVTEFAVIHGEYGAGKSHALRFLKTYIDNRPNEFDALAIYVERPRVSSKLNFELLSRYIFQQIGRERIQSYCRKVRDILDAVVQEIAVEMNRPDARDKATFLEEAYDRIREADRPMVRLLASGTQPGSKIFEYLTGQERCDAADSYEGKVDSDFAAAHVLGDFFRVLTSPIAKGEAVKEAVYLFIDECEMLIEAKTSESDVVFSGLRELLNGNTYRFCLIMSFSAATALIEAVMQSHLLKRLTRPYIEIPMLSDALARQFLRTQLDFYRLTPEFVGTFYPFSDEAVEAIIEHENSLTPRNLFIDCKRVFERALRRYDLRPGETISADVVGKVLGFQA
jgi:hypothetical protein